MLKLDANAYSPKVLHKFVETAGHAKSYDLAARLIHLNAEIEISGRHLNRLTKQIGQELEQRRDQKTEDYLHHRRETPANPPPDKVMAGIDGGRINTREPGHGPGVHEPGWRENKVGCLQILKGPSFDADPHPELPKCFADPEHVKQMVKGFVQQKGIRGYDEPEPEGTTVVETSEAESLAKLAALVDAGGSQADKPAAEDEVSSGAPAASQSGDRAKPNWPPKRSDRSCVSSLANSQMFGKMLAAEASARNFFAARERAFLGDGLAYNWRVQQKWFPDFTAVLDFIHPLSYVYIAAKTVTKNAVEAWQQYLVWIRDCWQGRVASVIAELRQEQAKFRESLGEADGKLPAGDPREVLRKTVNYLENNAARMNYPEYRKRGLCVTSAAVESLIKEFNYRVKGTEKFWDDPTGGEPILQIRAGVLSEDGRLETHILNRPGCVYRRRSTEELGETRQAA